MVSPTAPSPSTKQPVADQETAALMLDFLLTTDFRVDEAAAAKNLGEAAQPVLAAAIGALEVLPEFTAAPIEEALKAALIDGLGLKPRVAFAAVRVATTGRTISPPLYESLELLGRETSLQRLRAALTGA